MRDILRFCPAEKGQRCAIGKFILPGFFCSRSTHLCFQCGQLFCFHGVKQIKKECFAIQNADREESGIRRDFYAGEFAGCPFARFELCGFPGEDFAIGEKFQRDILIGEAGKIDRCRAVLCDRQESFALCSCAGDLRQVCGNRQIKGRND